MRLRLLTPGLSMIALGLVTACPDEVLDSEVACKTIGAGGDAVTSADSVITIAIRPDALSEPTQVCIQRAGDQDPNLRVYGPTYRVSPNIELEVPAAISYRYPQLRDDPDTYAIGVVLREEFEAKTAVWHPLPPTRIDSDHRIMSASDDRLSLFYGFLEDVDFGGEVTVGHDDSETSTTSDDATTTESTSEAPEDSSEASPTEPTEPTEPTDPGSESDDVDSDADSDTGPAFDCSALPEPPFDVVDLGVVFPGGFTEDITMSGNGTIVGESGNAIIEVDATGATVRTLHTPLAAQVLGITFDPDGNLVMARREFMDAEVVRVVGGTEQVVLGGLQFPNGVDFDAAGRLWVTEYAANTVIRIDANGQATDVLQGAAQFVLAPNGIFFDDERGRLYWSNYANGSVSSAPVDANGTVGASQLVFEVGITGGDAMARWDGITMDGCGHLYVVDQRGGAANPCGVHRIELDAAGAAVPDGFVQVAGNGDLGNGCANAEFGVGFGDENDFALFVSNENNNHLYRIDVGVGAR